MSKYKDKLFSVLGDSISTLAGYTEPKDAEFYEGTYKLIADVYVPEETWWGQVADALGGKILVNNSISGSMVVKHPNCEIPSYGCSDERTSALGKDGITPDVIMVFLGTNDWGYGMRPTPDYETEEGDLSIFSVAYSDMLDKLISNYPKAEIWCLTLPVSKCTAKSNFFFPYRYGGHHISVFGDVIRSCAEARGCRVIDLYACDTPHDTIDGFHPNADGMKTLSAAVLKCLGDSE